MKQYDTKQMLFLISIILGWIFVMVFIYNKFIRFDESEIQYCIHDVPALYENQYGMKFVYIKPGYFMMGNEEAYPFKVFVTNGFYIQQTEVTQAQWERVMKSNPSHFKNCGPDCPVEMISKNDAESFIHELNVKSDEKDFKYRLPTEAEWEYAATSGNNNGYENAESFEKRLMQYCWHSKNSLGTTHPVASKNPNALGIFDLQGNVNEWCADVYTPGINRKNIINPLNKGGDKSGNHVVRGGSWRTYYYFCRVGTKAGRLPNARQNDVGLRLVIEIKAGVPASRDG